MKNLLVVIDVINGFSNFGNLADKSVYRTVPSIERAVKFALDNDYDVISFKDTHREDDPELKIYPPHCLEGSEECELIPELKPYESEMTVLKKSTTNGF